MIEIDVDGTEIANNLEEEKVAFLNKYLSCSFSIDYKTIDFMVQNFMKEYYKKKLDEAVNHPNHYAVHPSGVECVQLSELLDFCKGNAFKYVWRAGKKFDAEEDLKKARFYLNRSIKNSKNTSALILPNHYEMILQVVKTEPWEAKGKALFFIISGFLETSLKYIEEMEKDIASQKQGEEKNG